MYSFADTGWSEVSFEVNEHAPKTTEFAEINGVRLSKIAGLFGPNASGKTNVIKVLNFIRYFIAFSFLGDRSKVPPSLRNTLHYDSISHMGNQKENSCEVAFFINSTFYTYSFAINKGVVSKEKLSRKEQGKSTVTVFERDYQNLTFKNFNDARASMAKAMLKTTGSVTSTFASLVNMDSGGSKEMENIRKYWSELFIASDRFSTPYLPVIDVCAKKYRKLNLEHKLKEFWKETDIGSHEVSVEYTDVLDVQNPNQQATKKKYLLPIFKRSNKTQNSFKIYLHDEANGILEIFFKLFQILCVTEGMSPIVVMDELEVGLHPEAVSKLLSLFLSSDNVRGQILFTTHMTPLLMNMNKYQVQIVEKNENNESEIFRLDQVDNVRSDDNIFKKYMSGIYGGFPDIDY